MRLDKRTVKLAGLALTVAFLSASSGRLCRIGSRWLYQGGGGEAGGVYGTGGENETAGVLWGEGSSESGGANDSGSSPIQAESLLLVVNQKPAVPLDSGAESCFL
ncbi:MAG: hypothetical protein R3C24_05710 [Cyanobacteriota/Melainabacteria group bacterium]